MCSLFLFFSPDSAYLVQQMWPQASRVATRNDSMRLLKLYTAAVRNTSYANGYTQTGGGGLEAIAGAEGVSMCSV